MGPPVAVLLVAVMALWCLLAGWAIRCVSVLPGAPLFQAMVWTATEVGAAAVPLGGFGWVRLAWTVVDTPWVGALRWAGTTGTSLLVALAAALLARVIAARGKRRVNNAVGLMAELVVVAVLATVSGAIATRDTHDDSVRVLVVQGGVDGTAGPYAMGYARSVTDNHLSQTIMAVAEQRVSGKGAPDMILWPENSTDIDPILDVESHQIVIGALAISKRPILVGAVTDGPGDDERQTTSMWWPASSPKPTSIYHKRNLVPFGEWIPARSFFLPLIPILENIGRQSVPGTTPGVRDSIILTRLFLGRKSRSAWWSVSRLPMTTLSRTRFAMGQEFLRFNPTTRHSSIPPKLPSNGRSPERARLKRGDTSSSRRRIPFPGWSIRMAQ